MTEVRCSPLAARRASIVVRWRRARPESVSPSRTRWVRGGGSGLELLRAIAGESVGTRIVLLTAVVDDDQLLEAIRLGAQGVVLKDMAPQLLVDAIREVHRNGQWLEHGLDVNGRIELALYARENGLA